MSDDRVEWIRARIRDSIARNEAAAQKALSDSLENTRLGIEARDEGRISRASFHFSEAEKLMRSRRERTAEIRKLQALLQEMTGPEFGTPLEWIPPRITDDDEQREHEDARRRREQRESETIDDLNRRADELNRAAINELSLFDRMVDRLINFLVIMEKFFRWGRE